MGLQWYASIPSQLYITAIRTQQHDPCHICITNAPFPAGQPSELRQAFAEPGGSLQQLLAFVLLAGDHIGRRPLGEWSP